METHFQKMSEGMRGWSISRALIIELRMSTREEAEAVSGNREKGEGGVEGEIRMRSLSLHLLLNLYGEMSRPFNDRWLSIALNPSRLELSAVN
jgi:hypothetical protein